MKSRGKKIATLTIAGLAAAFAGFVVYAHRPEVAPVSRPLPSSFRPELVAAGAQIAGAGFCTTCHTAKGGAPLSGGRAFATQFGTIYSTNITPDPATGLGNWSLEAFKRAMREGVSRNGSHLFPAFPYDHFTKMRDEDLAALYAWVMTRPAVSAKPRKNELVFPLGWRPWQAGWKLLFFRPASFQPEPGKSAEWNRGAYLAEAVSHCGACHSPRNSLGAEQQSHPYAGAAIDGWIAPPLDATSPAPALWDQAGLYEYLRFGRTPGHGAALGPMREVTHSLESLPDQDIHALAAYFASMQRAKGGGSTVEAATAAALQKSKLALTPAALADPDARRFASACLSCHYNSGATNPGRPELALSTTLYLDDPTNLIRIILSGVGTDGSHDERSMPSFGIGLNDRAVAEIAGWLRSDYTDRQPWPDLEKQVARVREQLRTERNQP